MGKEVRQQKISIAPVSTKQDNHRPKSDLREIEIQCERTNLKVLTKKNRYSNCEDGDF